MIAIIDHGSGNLRSIQWAFRRAGAETVITAVPEGLEGAERIVLPGVGSFGAAMRALREQGLITVLERRVLEEKTPLLGICLGFQMLTEGSEEGAGDGLGWIKGRSRRFRPEPGSGLRVPQLGWNEVVPAGPGGLLAGYASAPTFYFAHSYFVECDEPDAIAGTTQYGHEYVSVVQKGNIFGAQFHPEKSHLNGQRFLQRFLELTAPRHAVLAASSFEAGSRASAAEA